jgi:hypothetical protein
MASSAHQCPNCLHALPDGCPRCFHCGFSLATLDGLLGAEEVILERIHDEASCFSTENISRLSAAINAWENRFPGYFAAVYAGPIPAPASARTFGTWLLNRAALPGVDLSRPNDCGLLMVLDPAGGEFAAVTGYALEAWLPEPVLNSALQATLPQLATAQWLKAVLSVLSSLGAHLATAASQSGSLSPNMSRGPAPTPLANLPRIRRHRLPAPPQHKP